MSNLQLFQQHGLDILSQLLCQTNSTEDEPSWSSAPLLIHQFPIAITCPPRSIYKLPPGWLFYLPSACSASFRNHSTCETHINQITLLILHTLNSIFDLMHQSKTSIKLPVIMIIIKDIHHITNASHTVPVYSIPAIAW